MGKLIDLHTHSNCSDGRMSPTELVIHAKNEGMAAISLTDHDTAAGVDEAISAGSEHGVEVITGIELSTESTAETHILGYFIDPHDLKLNEAIVKIINVREQRMEETCLLLGKHGISVTLDEVKVKADGGILCRAHIAKIMTEKGYTSSPKEAFDLWLSPDCPAYSSSQAITDREAIELIRGAGGDAYLAHLNRCKMDRDTLDSFVKRLKNDGLCGIEGYYTEYTQENQREYLELAEKFGLKISGGTDFHGANKPHIKIGRGEGNLSVPYTVLEKMKEK